MRLRHIEVFHAVMQAGTISGAAQLLHISQPAATKVLQHFELHLGLPLFERVRGKLYPTPEAERLFTEVERLNRGLVAVRRLAVSLEAGESETVRFTVTPALGSSVVPTAMTRWCKAFPKARCELSTHHTREIVNALLLSEADFALSLQDPRHPSILAESLASGPLMVLGQPGKSRTQDRSPMTVSDIKDELISFPGADPIGSRVLQACEAAGVEINSRLTVQTYQLARTMVEAGVGMAVVDPFTAASAENSGLSVRPLMPSTPVHLYLLTAQGAPLSQASRRLVKYVGEAALACLAQLNETATV